MKTLLCLPTPLRCGDNESVTLFAAPFLGTGCGIGLRRASLAMKHAGQATAGAEGGHGCACERTLAFGFLPGYLGVDSSP